MYIPFLHDLGNEKFSVLKLIFICRYVTTLPLIPLQNSTRFKYQSEWCFPLTRNFSNCADSKAPTVKHIHQIWVFQLSILPSRWRSIVSVKKLTVENEILFKNVIIPYPDRVCACRYPCLPKLQYNSIQRRIRNIVLMLSLK
jgi:hypothetical protein